MVNPKMIIALILVAALVANITLFAFRVLGVGTFWLVIGVVALITYVMFPKKRK